MALEPGPDARGTAHARYNVAEVGKLLLNAHHVQFTFSPVSMGFPRQRHWSRLPFPPPETLPDPETEPAFPALQAYSLPLSLLGSPPSKSTLKVLSLQMKNSLNLH